MADNQNLIPFTKGDARINRNGRPPKYDLVRQLAKEIGHESSDLKHDGVAQSRIQAILRDWAESKDVHKQLAFIQCAFGKIPTAEQIKPENNTIIVEWTDIDPEKLEVNEIQDD